jgi:CHAT domain-containing protein
LTGLGLVTMRHGDLPRAKEYLRQALEIHEKLIPNTIAVASNLQSLGLVAWRQGELANAEEYFRQAVAINGKLAPNGTMYADSLTALAEVLWSRHQLDEAQAISAHALQVLERQLTFIGGSSAIRTEFRAAKINAYYMYAAILIEQSKLKTAFEVIERSRARTLRESLTEAHLDIRQGADPVLIEKERLLQATLSAKANRKISLMEGISSEEQLERVNKEIDDLLAEYQDLEERIRFTNSKYAALTQPNPLSTEDLRDLLDTDTVLVEYVLGVRRSFLFLLMPTSGVKAPTLYCYTLPKPSEIEDRARRVYRLLASRNRVVEGESSDEYKDVQAKDKLEYERELAELSQILLGPIINQIEGKRLLVVTEGALQYIPFGALPIPANAKEKPAAPLVAEHEIVNLPSASVLAVLRWQHQTRKDKPTKDVAVLADPVFDEGDPRVAAAAQRMSQRAPSQKRVNHSAPMLASVNEHLARSLNDVNEAGRGSLSRLVFSRREAAAIFALSHGGETMEALDFEANRETATSKELAKYRIVHFATHGLLDNEHPDLSGLVLSLVGPDGKPRNGFVDLEDIYNLTLSADLVVLSACETALGKDISGEGLIGLTRGFMYAGASRVVASLWEVDDLATSELMKIFYEGMLKNGLSPAAALRRAQLEMLRQKRWSALYYWAAFTIQGDWK